MDHLPASFTVARMDVNGAAGIAVRGEVDIAVASRFEAALDAAIRDSVGAFVLDLCDVEFLDSSGLTVVMRARALLAREERALAVVCPDGSVRRLFDLAGVADLLFLYYSREEVARELLPAA